MDASKVYRIKRDVPLEDRLIIRSNPVPGQCTQWLASCTSSGYPQLKYRGHTISAHRLACWLAHGDPPPDKPLALHGCGNKWCTNPRHLRWGDWRDNYYDWVEHRRQAQLLAAA